MLSTDDLMGETKTDRNGYFRVVGKIREISTIDPKLNVYHDCNDGWKVRFCREFGKFFYLTLIE